MRIGRKQVGVGVLAAALVGISPALYGQPAGQTATAAGSAQHQNAQQQDVPDAPRPQTLPRLNTITAPAPALPNAPSAAAPAPALPAAPTPSQQVQDEGPPPELPPAGQGPATVIHVPVNFVEVPFTVKDSKGHLVPGLTWRDVQVYENGVRQQMKFFTTDPFPLSVALVIDQSVTFDTMQKINNALDALQGAFTKYDSVAIFTYNNGVREQTPFIGAQSARLMAIVNRSKGPGREPTMQMGGPLDQTLIKNNQIVDPNTTAVRGQQGITQYAPKEYHTLNDAILAAAETAAKAPPGRRRIVYVISDGKEYGSTAKEKDVIRYCQTNKIAVYATLVGDSSIPGVGFLDRIHLPLTMRDNALPRYTAATGGQMDYEFRQRGIETSFARIAEEVRTQYTLGYYSHESLLDEKYRKLEVRVLRPNLTVIAKPGYYPTPARSAPTPVTPSAVP